MVLDLWMYQKGTISGHILLFDVGNVRFGHATRVSLTGMKKFTVYMQNGLPVRLKGIHLMNATPALNIFLTMSKPFVKKELLDMVNKYIKTQRE